MLNQLKVGQKILVVVMAVALVQLLTSMVTFQKSNQLNNQLNTVMERGQPATMALKDMEMQIIQIQQWLTDISATRGQDGLDDGYTEAEKAYQLLKTDMAVLHNEYQLEKNSIGDNELTALQQQIDSWYATGKKMAQGYIEGGPAVGNKLMGEFDGQSTQMQQALQPIRETFAALSTQQIKAAQAEAWDVETFGLIASVISLAILGGGGWLLSHNISRPLNQMSETMSSMIERKDFRVHLTIEGKDEIARAGHSFNQLISMLQHMMRDLANDVTHIDKTTIELSKSIQATSHSADQTSHAASSMAAATEEMAVSLSHMHSNTDDLRKAVDNASRLSHEGAGIIEQAIGEMSKISSSVDGVSGVISQLGDQTSHISDIVQVIRDVADQTNLLALNAAIEAARAGEQGRGFAVVADEVRNLAVRTANATQEITKMIQTVQQSARLAVQQMDGVVDQANAGAQLAKDAGVSIQQIRHGSDEVAAAFEDITLSMGEQSHASEDIARQVEQVAAASQENSEAVHMTREAAAGLEQLSSEIKRWVDQIKVG